MSTALLLDTRQFDRALVEYAAASKKDFADVCNRQMLNLAIHGLQFTRKAEESAIASLESKEWWPRYVAKIMVGRGINKVMRASAKGAKFGARAGRKFMTRAYTRDQARAASKKLIRKRLRAVRFLKFFFIRLGQAVQPFTKGKRTTGKSFAGFQMRISPATVNKPKCDISVAYDYRKRSKRTARRTERLLNDSLRYAYPATAADMRKYIQDKARKTAQKHSGRRVV